MNSTNLKRLRKFTKEFLRKSISQKVWLKLARIKSVFYKNSEMFEEYASFGELNPTLKFYVIRRTPPAAGLLSNFNFVLQGIIDSLDKGAIPVVDMLNFPTEYSIFRDFNGSKNAWEYFFKPITPYDLNEVYKSKNVILSKGNRILNYHFLSGRNLDFMFDKEKILFLHNLCREYIEFNTFFENYLKKLEMYLDFQPEFTLGISLRGSDYLKLKPIGHPIQPDIESAIEVAKSFIDAYQIKRIFIATEDSTIRSRLENSFKGISYPNIRFENIDESKIDFFADLKVPSKLKKSLSYLAEMVIISKCAYNISSMTNGSAVSHILNGNQFREKYIFNLGVY